MLQTKTIAVENECYFDKVLSPSKNGAHFTNTRSSSLLHHRHHSQSPPPLPNSIVAQAGDVDALLPENEHLKEDYNEFDDSELLDENDNPFDKKNEDDVDDETEVVGKGFENLPQNNYSFKWEEVIWSNVLLISAIHLIAGYTLYMYIIGILKWQNVLISYLFGAFSAFGVTVGAHRLWAHRSFKAKWPLRVLLAFCNTCALQTDIYDWCRDHRVHHRFSETNADPHNSNRGFFFAHCGWLMLKKHPEVTQKGRTVDLSDLLADPVVAFQRRWYLPLGVLCWGVVPTLFGSYVLDETLLNSFLMAVMYRYVYVLNLTWNVNSAAHLFGNRPYTVKINPRENKLVTYLSFGEGYHNYHHAFPYDYSASEFGLSNSFSLSTAIIEFFEKLGLAYDLKKPNPETVKQKAAREGDKSSGGNESFLGVLIDWVLGLFFVSFAASGTTLARVLYQWELRNY